MTLLKKANEAFIEGRYSEALNLYRSVEKENVELKDIIKLNVKLASYYEKGGYKSIPSKEKIVVYTCNFGRYETVKEPKYVDPSVEYILFTDDASIKSKIWKIVLLDVKLEDPRRASRLPKILPHKYLPNHDVSIYIDSSLQLKEKNIRKMVLECMGGKDIALYPHYKRNCVYDEIEFVMNSTDRVVANKDLCFKQIDKYKNIGYPKNSGLFENAFIFRKNNLAINKLNETWWQEYEAGTERDQFTFMYALAVHNVYPNKISVGKQFRINPYVDFYKHSYKSHASMTTKKPYVFIAYAPKSYNMNLGRCYNEYMERLGEDEYALFIDHDAAFVDESWLKVVMGAYEQHGKSVGLFIGQTNRINNPYQRLNLLEEDHNLDNHTYFAKELFNNFKSDVFECSKLPSSSGVIIMLSKRTWHKHKFSDGFLKVDNNMHLAHRNAKDPVYLLKGLHVYHFYRADNDFSHAIRDISKLPKEGGSSIGHVVRNFVYDKLDFQAVNKYMGLLEDDEYGVFIPEKSMFCNKDWYLRIGHLLENDTEIGMLVFNDNYIDNSAPYDMDVLKHKQYASSIQIDSAVCLSDKADQLKDGKLSSFLISKKVWKKLVEKEMDEVSTNSLNFALKQVGQKAKFVKHIYVLDKNKDHRQKRTACFLKSKLNVGVLTFGFWPQQAGMEMMVHNLSTQLTKSGSNVVLFAPKPKKDFEELKGNYIIRRFKSNEDMKRIFRDHHASMPFDVLYVQGAYEPASLALELKKEFDIPVVLRTHGEDIQIDKESGYGYRLDPLKNDIILNNLRSVDHNVVIGPHIYDEVKALTHNPVSLVHNGVDTIHFSPGREYILHDKFNLPYSTKILITVGRNVKKKSLHLAVDALLSIKEKFANVVLIHAGKDGNGVNLESYAKERGVADSFYQLGEVSYFEMPKIYRSSDIFVFPAKTETFGNVTVEAMACGLPCVEFDYLVNRDKILDGVSGFIVSYGDVENFADKILYLLSSEEQVKLMGEKSRQIAETKFSWNSVVRKYLNILKG